MHCYKLLCSCLNLKNVYNPFIVIIDVGMLLWLENIFIKQIKIISAKNNF